MANYQPHDVSVNYQTLFNARAGRGVVAVALSAPFHRRKSIGTATAPLTFHMAN